MTFEVRRQLFGNNKSELRHEYREFVPMTADIAPLQRQCREASQKTY